MPYLLRRAVRYQLFVFVAVLSGCHLSQPQPPVVQPPVAMYEFTLDSADDDVVGHLQVTQAHEKDTLLDIARRFNVGYEEIVRANPNVDKWLPHEGTRVVVPTQFVLPDVPHRGIVINLAALRLYYYPPAKEGEPQTVITHPIGIGRVGWSTPLGHTKIVRKRANPVWYPPLSVRREHAKDGDILPKKIGAGPDNPLGHYAFTLGWPSYLLHGTNEPYGVGLRASHGCMRMYPEDIEQLFKKIPVGTEVTVVNQPLVYGYRGDTLYLQSYPVLEDYAKNKKMTQKGGANAAQTVEDARMKAEIAAGEAMAIAKAAPKKLPLDLTVIDTMIKNPDGIALPVSQPQVTLEKFIAAAPRVENRLPLNATWDGIEEK